VTKLVPVTLSFFAIVLVLSGCAGTAPTPVATPTPQLTPSPAPTLAATPAPTPTATLVATAAPTPVATPVRTATPAPAEASVTISGFAFEPQTLTVSAGTQVTWTNNDQAPHTVVSNDRLFESPSLSRGATWSRIFNTAGTFDYHCSLHPSMTGRIVVE